MRLFAIRVYALRLCAALFAFLPFACQDDDEPSAPSAAPPTVGFTQGEGYLYFNQSVVAGTAARVGVTVRAGDDKRLDKYRVIVEGDTVYAVDDLSGSFFEQEYAFVVPEPGTYLYEFYAEDREGYASVAQLLLESVAPDPTAPTVAFMGEGFPDGQPSTTLDLEANQTVTVSVRAEAAEGKRLVRVAAVADGRETLADLDFSALGVTGYTLRQEVSAPGSGAREYLFFVEDDQGATAELALTVNALP